MLSSVITTRFIRQGCVLAIIVVLALAGHDGLMAAGAHDVPGMLRQAERHSPNTQHHDAGHWIDMTSRSGSTCAVVTPAVFRPDNVNVRSAAAVTVIGIFPPTKTASWLASGFTEPTSPPGTRRALLQVYRI